MKTIEIPINDTESLVYRVEFIGLVGSRAGKPYVTEESDSDYFVALTLLTDPRDVLFKDQLRYTWNYLNSEGNGLPIMEQIHELYSDVLPVNFMESDVKISEVSHLFKQLLAQSLDAYDMLFTEEFYYKSDNYNLLQSLTKQDDIFLNSSVFLHRVKGHMASYVKQKKWDKAYYLKLKYQELCDNIETNGVMLYSVSLDPTYVELYKTTDHKELIVSEGDEFFKLPNMLEITPNYSKITAILQRMYK